MSHQPPAPSAQNGTREGFTIIEIIMAMGIFALGISYVFELFQHSLRITQKARQQVILSILYTDIKSKQQTAAVLAVDNAGEDTFAARNAGGGWITKGVTVGLHDYGSDWAQTKAAYNNLVPDTDEIDNDTGEFKPDGVKDYYYENIGIYQGFMFAVNTVFSLSDKESNQFVDWDGYSAVDADGVTVAGITEEDVQEEFNGVPGFQGGVDGIIPHYLDEEPSPTPGADVEFDPDGLRHYIRRFKCIIAFDYDGDDPPGMFTGTGASDNYTNTDFCQHEIFYFDIFNPDTDKDTTQP